MPRVSKMSFRAMGTPCIGPRYLPRAISRSAARACRRASSAVTVMKASSCGWNVSMRSRYASASSTGDSLRALMSLDASAMVRKQSSSDMTSSLQRS
jgi:hypothetical protein